MLMLRRGSGSVILASKAELLIGAVIAASAGFSGAHAASFGHSRIVSALGQPLHVEIPVTQLTEQEIVSLHAAPAPAQAWRDAGMTPPVALDSMRLVLLDGYRPGVKVIQLRSHEPFDNSIVDVLLDITSASGQQRYQVSLFAQADRQALVRAGGENARNPRSIDGRADTVPSGSHATAGARIPVRAGDNMFAIAQRNAVEGVSVYQLMMALQRANPGAFIEDNVNLVKAGVTLVMPDLDVLMALSDREARRLFRQHADAFARYRQRGGGAGAAMHSAAGVIVEEAAVAPEGGSSASLGEAQAQGGDRLRLSGGRDAVSAGGANSSPGVAGAGVASGGANAAAVAGSGVAGQAGASAAGAAGSSPAGSTGINLLAANGTIASDAVAGMAPDASGGDRAGNGGNRIGAVGDGGAATGPDNAAAVHPDDQAALRKGVEESRTRILELEDNVKHLNEALQKQGQIAAEAALEGARSVSEAIKEAIGITPSDGEPGESAAAGGGANGASGSGTGASTGGQAGTPSPGDTSPSGVEPAAGAAAEGAATGPGAAAGLDGAAGPAGPNGTAPSGTGIAASGAGAAGAPATSGASATAPATGPRGTGAAQPGTAGVDGTLAPTTSSRRAEEPVSWLQENMLLALAGGLALVVLIVAWILRRAGASRRDAFESDSPITDAMVREKLQEIDLELGEPSTDSAGRRTH